MVKKVTLFFILALRLVSEEFSLPPLPRNHETRSDLMRYGTAGFSSFLILPYIANTSIGLRKTNDKSLIGLDGSLNFSTNFSWYHLYAKGFLPFYFTPSKAKNSFYLGPYISIGKTFQEFVGNSADLYQMNTSPALESGLTFGRNIGTLKVNSFFQITARCVSLKRKIIKDPYYIHYKEGSYKFYPIAPFLFRFEWGFAF